MVPPRKDMGRVVENDVGWRLGTPLSPPPPGVDRQTPVKTVPSCHTRCMYVDSENMQFCDGIVMVEVILSHFRDRPILCSGILFALESRGPGFESWN